MALDLENGKKPESVLGCKAAKIKAKMVNQLPMILRWTVLIATATATVSMGLNKQTKTAVVAIVGTTPISQTFTAKFNQTPAFVYFVIANGITSLYCALVLLLRPYIKGKGNNLWAHILDTVMLAIAATGAAAATSMAELGKNGNSHARWNPICDKFNAFCLHGGMALIASFVGSLNLLLLNILSLVSLHKTTTSTSTIVSVQE